MTLTMLLILPLLGLIVVLFLDKEKHVKAVQYVALAASGAALLWSVYCCAQFSLQPNPGPGKMRLEQSCEWIPTLGIKDKYKNPPDEVGFCI